MPKRYWFTLAFIGWMVFVSWASLASFSDDGLPFLNIPYMDKWVHFTFYFVGAILGTFAIREKEISGMTPKRASMFMVGAMILFGILIEALQYYMTTDRTGDIYDALANSTGAICGALAIKFLFSGRLGLKWRQ